MSDRPFPYGPAGLLAVEPPRAATVELSREEAYILNYLLYMALDRGEIVGHRPLLAKLDAAIHPNVFVQTSKETLA